MKIRTGFVSNSSSSSFVCDVCGETTSGWDMGLEDAAMIECTNGHTFCESHCEEILKKSFDDSYRDREFFIKSFISIDDHEKAERIKEMSEEEFEEACDDDEFSEITYNLRYNASPDICPICQLRALSKGLMLEYLCASSGTSEKQIVEEVQKRFSDYSSFEKFIKEGK